MSLDFTGSTSRRALIVGMTNTDQSPMWQARAPAAATVPDHAERLDDAGDAGGGGSDGGSDINEETGLNAAEQAEFERMASGDPAPPAAGDAPGDDDQDGDGDGDGDGSTDPAPAAPPVAGEKTPAQLATEAPQGQKPKTINFNRHQRELKAATDRAAAAEALATKSRDDAIKLGERVAIINEALAAQPAAAAPAVDPNAPPENPFDEQDINPEEDYAASVKQIQRRQRFQMEHQGRIEQDVVESQQDRDMRDTFTRDFQSYAASEQGKDLPQAYQFLKDSRLTEICISEFDKDPNDPNEQFTKAEVAKMVQMFNAEEKWVVGNAIKQSKSPAAAIMKLARARGFKPAAAAPAPRPAPSAAPAPAARAAVPAVRPAAAAVPSAAAELAALATNVQNGRSLSDGGGAPPQGLTAEILLNMSAEEFEEMIDTLPTHQLNTLMGRDAG